MVRASPISFHTGSRSLFGAVKAAIEKVLPLKDLRYIAFSHYEQDECGAMNALLAAAPQAVPIASRINAMINGDAFDRPQRALADGEVLKIGRYHLRWLDTPHLPHGWECGYFFEEESKTLFCGDLFTQPGSQCPPLTEKDVLGPSEEMRKQGADYFANGRETNVHLEKLAALNPRTMTCMHGSAWTGDGAALLRELSRCLSV